jgi:hypothetical protein
LYCPEVNYLVKYRLQWGKPDTLSLLQSSLDQPVYKDVVSNGDTKKSSLIKFPANKPVIPVVATHYPTHFTADTPAELISIIQNDWPYSG